MTNLASVLKSEVTRLARKELRAETEALRQVVAAQRADIAALKRRTSELEKAVKALVRTAARHAPTGRPASPPQERDDDSSQFRFRAQGMASNRKRLGLSAEDFGLLVGASGQAVYAWESGKSKPRAKNPLQSLRFGASGSAKWLLDSKP